MNGYRTESSPIVPLWKVALWAAVIVAVVWIGWAKYGPSSPVPDEAAPPAVAQKSTH